MKTRFALVCAMLFVTAACTPGSKKPDGTSDAVVALTADAAPAPVETVALSPETPAPFLPLPEMPFAAYAKLCRELETSGDAGTTVMVPSVRRASDIIVSAQMKMRGTRSTGSEPGGTELVASVVAPTIHLERDVFNIQSGTDPFQCCSEATANELRISCTFSGLDQVEGRTVARRDGDALIVRWCTADTSTKTVSDRGEVRTPLALGAVLRFSASTPRCMPASFH